MQFISERVVPAPGTADLRALARREPGLPSAFTWRRKSCAIAALLETWKTLDHPGPRANVRRHWFRVQAVTVRGANFCGAPAVSFGGSAAANVSVVNEGTITCQRTARPAGVVDVTVTTAYGTGTLSAGYEYVAPPEFTLSPSASPSPAVVNRNVSFNCGVSDPGGHNPVTLTWDFGDGGSAVGQSVGHTYRLGKTYQVPVTATNALGYHSMMNVSPDLIVRPTFGQFNADASTDIAWWNNDNGNIYACEMNGTTKLAETLMLDVDHTAYSLVGTGDFERRDPHRRGAENAEDERQFPVSRFRFPVEPQWRSAIADWGWWIASAARPFEPVKKSECVHVSPLDASVSPLASVRHEHKRRFFHKLFGAD